MRAAFALAALGLAAAASPARADDLPPGAMGVFVGAIAGTGPDASKLGAGYVAWPPSFQAAWQPMKTEQRVGYTLRWSTLFSSTYNASAAQVTDLESTEMDLTLGIRVRPGANLRRYITARVGAGVYRANQQIPPQMERAFVGAVGSVGFQQYLLGTRLLLDVDVRYGLIGDGPTSIALTFGLSIAGP